MPGPTVVLLYCVAPDVETADAIAAALVEERLAACVNALPSVRATYRWEGAIAHAEEVAMIVKTTDARAEAAADRIAALHPYETPAVLAIDVAARGSAAAFLDWVAAETAQ
ncbi:MAG: divalent-cation tolerance protein CutA [Parvularculaceae bacterium]